MNKIIGLYLSIMLILVFIIGNYSASMYGKELIGVLVHKLPYNLKISQVDSKYAIYDSETELAVVFPEENFTLDETVFVEEIEKLCEYEKFLAIQFLTNDNTVKILTIWEENKSLKGKVYDTSAFYAKNTQYNRWIGLQYTLAFIKLWKILGIAIIIALVLVIWLTFFSIKQI